MIWACVVPRRAVAVLVGGRIGLFLFDRDEVSMIGRLRSLDEFGNASRLLMEGALLLCLFFGLVSGDIIAVCYQGF